MGRITERFGAAAFGSVVLAVICAGTVLMTTALLAASVYLCVASELEAPLSLLHSALSAALFASVQVFVGVLSWRFIQKSRSVGRIEFPGDRTSLATLSLSAELAERVYQNPRGRLLFSALAGAVIGTSPALRTLVKDIAFRALRADPRARS